MCMLLETALALFAGLMMTRVFKYMKLNFPDVTAFRSLCAGKTWHSWSRVQYDAGP